MKVIFLRSNPVNPDPRVEKEVNGLLKDKYEINIVAWDREDKYSAKQEILKLRNGQCNIIRFGIKSTFGAGFKKNLIPLIKFQLCLLKWLIKNRNEYNIIHACDFDTVLPAFICKKVLKKKYVYDIFDYYVDAYSVPRRLKRVIEKIDHSMINNSEATIICTEKRKEQIYGTKPNKLEVIHNSPNKYEKLEVNKFNIDNDKMKIAYVGILNDGRYILETIDIIKDIPECELHIGGFGKLEEEIKKISKKYKNIKFYGKLEYDLTLELESICDIMIAIYDPNIPNHYYAAPNKFYEALMLGKPLIMVKDTGMDDIVLKYNIGEVINLNEKDLKLAIYNLLDKKKLWHEKSKIMKELYNNEYSWDSMEKKLIELYNNIIIK